MNDEDPFENEGTRVVTTWLPLYVYGDYSRCLSADNSEVSGRILPYFKLIQAFIVVLVS